MIGLMNIRGVIVMAWAAANGALVGVMGHELDWEPLQEPPRPLQTAQAAPEVTTEALPNFQLPPLEKKFTATTERPLFVSTRRKPPPPGTEAQVKPTMKKGQFQLLGTTITDEFSSAIVRELATGKIRPVMQDKLINGLLLESVEADRIVFTQYDDKEELLLKIQPSLPRRLLLGHLLGQQPQQPSTSSVRRDSAGRDLSGQRPLRLNPPCLPYPRWPPRRPRHPRRRSRFPHLTPETHRRIAHKCRNPSPCRPNRKPPRSPRVLASTLSHELAPEHSCIYDIEPMMKNPSSKHPQATKWLLSSGLPLLLVTGCATSPAPKDAMTTADSAVAGEASLPAQTAASAKASGAKNDDDRFQLYPAKGPLVKEAPPVPAFKQAGGNVTLNFEGADLREVVRTVMGDILKENYIVDPRVGGSITLRTAKPIPKSAALHTLEEVLRMNGAVVVKEADGVYRVVPFALAGKGNLTPQLSEGTKPLPSGYSIQIVPLKYIGVADMARILEPLAGEPSSVRPDPLRNMLILSGTQLQLRHMLDTIDMFDVDWISGMSVGLFTLKNIDAKTVSTELEQVFGDKNLGPLAGAIRIVPMERLNALLVVTPQAHYLDEARKWVERIDRSGSGSGGQRLYVYALQNGKAEQMAELLNDAFGKQKAAKKESSPSLAPGLKSAEVKSTDNKAADTKANTPKETAASTSSVASSRAGGDGTSLPDNVRVIADKDNNALLIVANAADYENIESAIKKLDIAPRQVLIEVTIAEVKLKDELKYGLEWFFKNGSRIEGKLDVGSAGIAALVPGFSYSWVSASGDLSAILNALATDSKLKVISSPHVTVADNQEAKIQVGDKVPTISQTQTATNTTNGIISTVQYLETGVLLNVKPRINAGGLVSLEVSQEVSNAIATTTSGIDSPTIQKRAAESAVTIQSGQTLVLAGLISEEKSRGSEGLPLLSRIPVLGGLFGSESRTDNRTELIILITPKVLENSQEAADITDEYRKRLPSLESLMKSAGVHRPSTTLKLDDSLKKNP